MVAVPLSYLQNPYTKSSFKAVLPFWEGTFKVKDEEDEAIICYFTKLKECHIESDCHFKLPFALKLF